MSSPSPLPLTVVIAAYQCAERVQQTIRPWLGVAQEIIVVDQFSTDGTAERAEDLGVKVIRNHPPGGNFDINRKVGIQSAQAPWILYIDTDERPTPELIAELQEFLSEANQAKHSEINGVRIPNELYFLGKSLRHGIYNPRTAAEIRLFRRDKWSYPCEEGYHRGISVEGKVIRFKAAYRHFNYNSLSEWFIKTNQYTEADALRFVEVQPDAKIRSPLRAFWKLFSFFFKHYIRRKGFLDGAQGLVSVLYFGLYHFTLDVKKWELAQRKKLQKEIDYIDPIRPQSR